MNKNSSILFRFALVVADACAIVFSFIFAYYIRINFVDRPYYFTPAIRNFAWTVLLLIPVWLLVLAALGLYQKSIFLGRSRLREFSRIFLASIIGTMSIITVSFIFDVDLFPARAIAVYSTIITFFSLILMRTILRHIRAKILNSKYRDHTATRVVIIGNNQSTANLISAITASKDLGYKVVAVVARNKYIPKNLKTHQFSSLKEALRHVDADAIFQTDSRQTEYVYKQSINHHLQYFFVPSEEILSSQTGELELIDGIPAILVQVTPLAGAGRVAKRFFDIVLSFLAIIVALIPMAIIYLAIKITEPKSSPIFTDLRLSRGNKKFKMYKFRSMKPEFSGMTPEVAFAKMGKPELSEKYRTNGDFLEDDPRITKIGHFLRSTSLDELPQLFNILKGDISLVGPRALIPGELRNYGDRSLLLSVKSGLTGLAQVSGRRDISFDERRALDLYYIRNWSLALDFQILLKTVAVVFKREGAK